MGRAYLLLWLFFLLIAGSRQAVLTAGADWPVALRFPLELGLATYLGLVLCALTGYALYQYHREIHMDVEVDFATHHRAGGAAAIARAGSTQAALRRREPTDPFERRLQGLVAEGRIADAIAAVKDEMRYARLDPKLNTRLHELYQQQGDEAQVLAHGPQWLAALGQAGQAREALAALKALRGIDPGFEVQDGHAALHCATAATRQGDHALAVQLLQGFDKRFPEHPETPAAFFIGARLMSEYARQHDKAAKILRAVLARWPEHALAAEVKTYLTVLEKSLTPPAASAASRPSARAP
jgi:tetratricopeptide (TPR) repeat protein